MIARGLGFLLADERCVRIAAYKLQFQRFFTQQHQRRILRDPHAKTEALRAPRTARFPLKPQRSLLDHRHIGSRERAPGHKGQNRQKDAWIFCVDPVSKHARCHSTGYHEDLPRTPIRIFLLALVCTYAFFFEYLPPVRRVHIPYDMEGYHFPWPTMRFNN